MDERQAEEMLEMVRENNSILRGMRRSALTHGFFKFLFWGAIIAAVYFAWQSYVQPTVQQASQTYQSAQGQWQSAQKSLEGVATAASSTESFFGSIRKNLGF